MPKSLERFFYRKYLDRLLDQLFDFHLARIKKNYLKRVMIVFPKEAIVKNAVAFIALGHKPPIIYFQYDVFRKRATSYMAEFLNDNVIDAIKHEFAHLKFKKEGKRHLAWMNKQKLFKK